MAKTSPVLLFSPAAVLRVVGPDSLSFLQGQFTQDLRGLGGGGAAYGLWLNQKGKVVGDAQVLCRGKEEWLLVSEFTAVAALRARLEEFLIADEVELHDETAHWVVGVDLAAPPLSVGLWSEEAEGVFRFATAGTLPGGLTLRVRTGELVLGDTSARTAYFHARHAALLPAIPLEFGEADLPQEAGLEVRAISFHKGCYLGQEVMARLHAMGQVRRALVRVQWLPDEAGTASPPEIGTPVLVGEGKRIGDLRGLLFAEGEWTGLAMLLKQALANSEENKRCGAGSLRLL